MPYEVPDIRVYDYNAINFVSGAGTRHIKGPKGKRGLLVDIEVEVTTSFVGTTTPGIVQVGESGDTDKYGLLNVGAAAAGTAAGSSLVASGSGTLSQKPNPSDTVYIDADEDVLVTIVAPTGGSPAGIGDVRITIDWSK